MSYKRDDLNSASQGVLRDLNVCKILDLVNSEFGIKISFGGMYVCMYVDVSLVF